MATSEAWRTDTMPNLTNHLRKVSDGLEELEKELEEPTTRENDAKPTNI